VHAIVYCRCSLRSAHCCGLDIEIEHRLVSERLPVRLVAEGFAAIERELAI